MINKSKSTRPIPKPLIILAVCLAIAIPFGVMLKREWDHNRAMADVDNRMKSYEQQIFTEVPNLCKSINLPITGAYTAQDTPELELYNNEGNYYFYDVKAGCAVTLHADSDFDKMEDREKYDILVSLYEQVEPIYNEFLSDSFPEFYNNPDWELIPHLFVSYKAQKCEAYIQTPEHLYQYSRYYDDLFILDRVNYYLMDEDSRWNRKRKETDSSGSYSGSGSGTGTHNSHSYEYTDADDYADEHYEEYMEEGWDEDEAYDQAYDDWE